MAHPALSNRASIPEKPARLMQPSGASPFGGGCAVDEKIRTEIPGSSGVGSLASNSPHRSTAANCPRHVKVLLRASGQAVSYSGFPVKPMRQVAGHPRLVAERRARIRLTHRFSYTPATDRRCDVHFAAHCSGDQGRCYCAETCTDSGNAKYRLQAASSMPFAPIRASPAGASTRAVRLPLPPAWSATKAS